MVSSSALFLVTSFLGAQRNHLKTYVCVWGGQQLAGLILYEAQIGLELEICSQVWLRTQGNPSAFVS